MTNPLKEPQVTLCRPNPLQEPSNTWQFVTYVRIRASYINSASIHKIQQLCVRLWCFSLFSVCGGGGRPFTSLKLRRKLSETATRKTSLHFWKKRMSIQSVTCLRCRVNMWSAMDKDDENLSKGKMNLSRSHLAMHQKTRHKNTDLNSPPPPVLQAPQLCTAVCNQRLVNSDLSLQSSL